MTSVHRHSQRFAAVVATRLTTVFAIAMFWVAPTAVATTPSCAPPSLAILGQASTSALVEFNYDDNNPINDPNRLLLRFESPTPELLALSSLDEFLLPPGTSLPTGFRGRALLIDENGPNELTIVAEPRRTGLYGTPFQPPVISVEPADVDVSRECFTLLPDGDLDTEGGTGIANGGDMEAQCGSTNGSDIAFSVEIAEGVEINGLLTATPYDIEGELELENFQLVTAKILSESRISFTGEISAEADAALPDEPIFLGTALLGKYVLKMGELSNIATLEASLFAEVFVGACGNISAGTRTGTTTTAAATLGIEYDNNVPRVIASTADTGLKVSPPELDSDVGADVTLYGGAALRLSLDLDALGIVPVAGLETRMTARGSARVEVDPVIDPWWRVSGRPEVFVDLAPELLTGDLTKFDFNIINPPQQTFFTANSEFPFNASASANRSNGTRESGTALRWARAHKSDIYYATNETVPTRDGGALVVADSAGFGTVLRVDYLGNRMWQRRIEGGPIPLSVIELPNDNVLVAGRRTEALWLLRLDADGNEIWSREFSMPDNNINKVFIAGVAGNDVILGGQLTTTDGAPEFEPWAARINAGGSVVWAWQYGQAGLDEEIFGVTSTSDNGVMLVGETDYIPTGPVQAGSNAYTLRLNADGTVRWSNVWASVTGERLKAVTQAPDGSFIAVGRVGGGNNQNKAPRGLVIRYDDDSLVNPTEPRWVRAFGGAFAFTDFVSDELVAVANSDLGFTIAGTSRSGNEQKAWLAEIVERGDKPDLVWSSYHDGLDFDRMVSLHDMGDGLLVGGDSKSFAEGQLADAIWVFKLPYESWMNWNTSSNATAAYTLIMDDEPVRFPLLVDSNITGTEDTTALEQQVALVFTVENSVNVDIIPDGFVARELVREELGFVDSDSDGIEDQVDNCTLVSNADQRDTNSDGYGNICDADLNNDGTVNFIDFSMLTSLFLMSDDDADLDGDGTVNFVDISIISQSFFLPPGPSGIAP